MFDKDTDNTNNKSDAETRADEDSFVPRVDLRPPVDVEAWDLEIESLDAQHMLISSRSPRDVQWQSQDSAQEMATNWHLGGTLATVPPPQTDSKSETKTSKPSTSLLAWTLMLCGVMAFACGAVLMGMSVAQARGELWRLGLPLALVGQCSLVVGLVIQLERVWSSHRRAHDRLHEVDEHVSDLQMTTDLLGTTHSGPSQAFYGHMAGGANTELLLADLKGQMDMLAAQMVRRGRR